MRLSSLFKLHTTEKKLFTPVGLVENLSFRKTEFPISEKFPDSLSFILNPIAVTPAF